MVIIMIHSYIMMIYGVLPSGYVKIAIEHGPVEIVDFPMKNAWWIFP